MIWLCIMMMRSLFMTGVMAGEMLIVSLSEGVLCDGNSGIAISCFPLRNS